MLVQAEEEEAGTGAALDKAALAVLGATLPLIGAGRDEPVNKDVTLMMVWPAGASTSSERACGEEADTVPPDAFACAVGAETGLPSSSARKLLYSSSKAFSLVGPSSF